MNNKKNKKRLITYGGLALLLIIAIIIYIKINAPEEEKKLEGDSIKTPQLEMFDRFAVITKDGIFDKQEYRIQKGQLLTFKTLDEKRSHFIFFREIKSINGEKDYNTDYVGTNLPKSFTFTKRYSDKNIPTVALSTSRVFEDPGFYQIIDKRNYRNRATILVV